MERHMLRQTQCDPVTNCWIASLTNGQRSTPHCAEALSIHAASRRLWVYSFII
jgi:hypothetical protein